MNIVYSAEMNPTDVFCEAAMSRTAIAWTAGLAPLGDRDGAVQNGVLLRQGLF